MSVSLINIPYLYETILSDSKNTWQLDFVKTVYLSMPNKDLVLRRNYHLR